MASILETFFILFKSNADDVKKGQQDAQKAGSDLEHQLGSVDRAGQLMGEHLVSTLKDVAIAFVAAFSAEKLVGVIQSTAEYNAQLGITAERLGISVSELDAWSRATEHAGGSAEGFTETLDFLNRGVADIATKGTSRLKPFFDELKIKVTDAPHHVRPLLDILGDLAGKLSSLSAQQRAGIAEKLGIDEGTVLLLAQGRRGVEDLVRRQKELGVATQEDADKAHKFHQALQDLESRFRHLATEAGGALLPALGKFFDLVGRIVVYLGQHKGLIEGFFIGVAAVVTAVYLPAMVEAAVATWAFLAPILAIVLPILAVGAAIALLVDDVQNFLAGNKSVIGTLSKTWPAVGETVRAAVHDIGAVVEWLVDVFKGLLDLAGSLGRLFGTVIVAGVHLAGEAFGWLGATAEKLWERLKANAPIAAAAFRAMGEVFKVVGGVIAATLNGIIKGVGWLVDTLGLLPKALHKWADEADTANRRLGGDPAHPGAPPARGGRPGGLPAAPGGSLPRVPAHVAAGLGAARGVIHTADTSPFSAGANVFNQKGGDRTINVRVDNVTVQTQATDGKTIMKEAAAHLTQQMRQAVAHFDDGVAV